LTENLQYLSEALPVKGRASVLISQFNTSLKNSLIYLINACDEVIDKPLFDEVSAKLNALNPKKKFSGLLNIIHSDLASAIQNEDVNKIQIIAKKLVRENFEVSDIKIINIDSLNDYYSPLIHEICREEIPEKIDFYPLPSGEFEQMKETTQKALQTINEICPDYFEEMESLLSEVLFIKADRIRHGSSLSSFGMIFRNYFFRWEHFTDTIDIMIHELSHLYLYILNTNDEIVINARELHESPLRVDKRPLIGIYHAAFVLSRVIDVLQKVLEKGGIPHDETCYCQDLIAGHKNRFSMAMDVLKTHAHLTALGQALITSASRLTDEPYAASSVADMPRAVR